MLKILATRLQPLTLSLPEVIMETCGIVTTFESVEEILWCDHSNETCLAVLLQDTIFCQHFTKQNLGIFVFNFDVWQSWELKGSTGAIC